MNFENKLYIWNKIIYKNYYLDDLESNSSNFLSLNIIYNEKTEYEISKFYEKTGNYYIFYWN